GRRGARLGVQTSLVGVGGAAGPRRTGGGVKQLVFMLVATGIGTLGALVSPFYGVAVYYLFAVLRPQSLWEWALPEGVQWSYYVALSTILTAGCVKLGILANPEPAPPGLRTYGRPHWALFAFFGWVSVSYLAAPVRQDGWFWYQELLKIVVMYAASALLIRSVRQTWILVLIAALSLAFIAYEVNILYLQTRQIKIDKVGFGGLDNNG